MGQMRQAQTAAWQQAAGIREATGDRAELLRRMSEKAFELIKIIELERSGIRDGDGHWSGADAMGGIARDMAALCNEWCSPKYDYD
jgi:acid phosphatase family membrane protein YuiD